MLQHRANKCVLKSLRKLSLVTVWRHSDLSNCQAMTSRPTGQQQRKPVGRTLQPVTRKNQESSTGGPENAAEKRRGRLVAEVDQVLRSLTLQLQATVHHDADLVRDL